MHYYNASQPGSWQQRAEQINYDISFTSKWWDFQITLFTICPQSFHQVTLPLRGPTGHLLPVHIPSLDPRAYSHPPSVLLTEITLRSSLLGIFILSIYLLFKQLLNYLTDLGQKSGNWECFPGVVVRIHPPTKTSPLETEQKNYVFPASPGFQWFYIQCSQFLIKPVDIKGQPQKLPSDSRSLLFPNAPSALLGAQQSPDAHLTPAKSFCDDAVCSGTSYSMSVGICHNRRAALAVQKCQQEENQQKQILPTEVMR